jgi:hypothetical protein
MFKIRQRGLWIPGSRYARPGMTAEGFAGLRLTRDPERQKKEARAEWRAPE